MSSSEQFNKSAGRGAIFQVSGGVVQTVIRIGASTILARLLLPSDFGLFGIALLLSELVLRIGALGMGVGIIAKKNVTNEDLCTAFWTMFGLRLVMFLTCFFLAPFLAEFFNDLRLTAVIRTISLTFLFQIIGVVGNALLMKQLQFFQIFIVNITSALIESGLAVFLVLFYFKNYWGLVIAMVSASLWRHLLVFFFSRWVPKPVFHLESFRFLFRYGINSLGESITTYFNQNIDFLLVGRLLGTRVLGFYEFAYRIPTMILDRIAIPVQAIFFPVLVHVNTSNEKLAAGYNKGMKYVSLICFPALGGLAVVAELAVPVLWGDQWLVIVPSLRILCLAAVLNCATFSSRVLFLCKDRPDIPFLFSLVSLVVTFLTVGFFGYFWGIIGIASAMLLSTSLGVILQLAAFRMINSSVIKFFKSLWPVIASTAAMGIVVYFLLTIFHAYEFAAVLKLGLSILSGAAVYILFLYFLFGETFVEVVETFIQVLGIQERMDRLKKQRAV